MRIVGLLLATLMVLAAGCQPPAGSASLPTGPRSVGGWEVRYQAVLSLARRGSPHIKDPGLWAVLSEMLDEEQQLRNFRARLSDGREVPDEFAARTTVIGALRAVQELHRKQPTMDLSDLKRPIEKLTHSPAAPVSTEAKQTLLALSPST